jgi:phage/plasmid-like protein (TIGR03299 family)
MAHRISKATGKAEFAYTGERPWHGLGEQVPGHMTVAEAFARVLPWTVSTRPVAYPVSEGGAYVNVAGNARAIVRDDTHTFLGMATKSYQPVQNAQAGEIVDALVAEGAECVETIGALDDGARCFTLVALDRTGFDVKAGDTVRPYFVLAWGHDGRHPVAGKLTTVRVVCHNTLTAAGFGEGKWSASGGFSFKHHASAALRIDEAREALGLARRAVDATRAEYQALAAASITPLQAADYFKATLPAPCDVDMSAGVSDADLTRLAKWEGIQRQIGALYAGAGEGAAPGTAWGAYNAVTEYLDHVYPVLANGKVSRERQQSVLFGAYAGIRDTAYAGALALVK